MSANNTNLILHFQQRGTCDVNSTTQRLSLYDKYTCSRCLVIFVLFKAIILNLAPPNVTEKHR